MTIQTNPLEEESKVKLKTTKLQEEDREIENHYLELKKNFAIDAMGTCTDVLLKTLAQNLYLLKNAKRVSDLEKVSKLITTLYSFRRDEDIVIPRDPEKAIDYLIELRTKDKIGSDKYKDVNMGIEQKISLNTLSKFRKILDDKKIEGLMDSDETGD